MSPPNDWVLDPPTPEERAFIERELAKLRARAEAGNAQAQRDLGCAYHWGEEMRGDLLRQDFALSRHWYVMAAEQGHVEAMSDVAWMLLSGEGGPVDIERGLRYLKFGANRRRWNPGAEGDALLLAFIYRHGQYGCAADKDTADFWESVAKQQWRKYRGYKRRHSWYGCRRKREPRPY